MCVDNKTQRKHTVPQNNMGEIRKCNAVDHKKKKETSVFDQNNIKTHIEIIII